MESQDMSAGQVNSSRPSLGFPLGTAFLLIFIFILSGIFSCCFHWDKLRSLRQSFRSHPPPKSTLSSIDSKVQREESLPVLMPGDEIPKFIAMPCPCEKPLNFIPDHHVITIHNSIPPPSSTTTTTSSSSVPIFPLHF